jgi:GNAT superfamily N-acetyltransferase
MKIIRTTSDNGDFRELVRELDKELTVRDGDEHAFYSQYNKLDTIRHAVVAYVDREAVGCGAIRPFDDETVEVKRMFVPTEHRGRGIAKEILRELEAWAVELSFKRCILETGLKQPEAIALYTKSGYTSIPNYGQYQGMYNSVCFEKIVAQ